MIIVPLKTESGVEGIVVMRYRQRKLLFPLHNTEYGYNKKHMTK